MATLRVQIAPNVLAHSPGGAYSSLVARDSGIEIAAQPSAARNDNRNYQDSAKCAYTILLYLKFLKNFKYII